MGAEAGGGNSHDTDGGPWAIGSAVGEGVGPCSSVGALYRAQIGSARTIAPTAPAYPALINARLDQIT